MNSNKISLLVGLTLLLYWLPGVSAPKAKLWPIWEKHALEKRIDVDHSNWQLFLDRYLTQSGDGIALVRYSEVSNEARKRLSDYLNMLQETPVNRLTRNQQRAFWINLYNAGTVQLILDNYPVPSIRDIDISPGLFADGPWGKKLFRIEGEQVSLNDIEHRILRPIWKDPRLHYALNCASLGCPDLQASAFTPSNTEQLLDSAARSYINHQRGVKIKDGELVVSSIYHWFKSDFGGTDKGVVRHMQAFAEPELARQLRNVDKIEDHDYSWSLNESKS